MKYVVSLSGGKDSTALLLMMLERGIPVHSAVFFDTGWEFPQMHDHIDKLESMVDVPIVRLKPERSFDYLMFEKPVNRKNGDEHLGYGWASPMMRWCTGEKKRTIRKYSKKMGCVEAIGFAADEKKRARKKDKAYPLIDWNITESQALAYCFERGFDWGGLYKHFSRVSCFCCPLQSMADIRTLRANFPELWQRMVEMDSLIQNNRGFRGYETVNDLERQFSKLDKQRTLWAA